MTVQEYPITNVKIADLKLDPDNPNQMTKDQEAALKKAMKRFGEPCHHKTDTWGQKR